YSYHFERHVAERIAVVQPPDMLAERVAGASSSILVSRMNPRDLLGCRMEDQRRIVDDTRQLADMLDEFREQELRRVLFPNLPEAILDRSCAASPISAMKRSTSTPSYQT